MVMAQYSMIQRHLDTYAPKVTLTFKPDDGVNEKLKKVIQYISRLVKVSNKEYNYPINRPELSNVDFPNAPTVENIEEILVQMSNFNVIKERIHKEGVLDNTTEAVGSSLSAGYDTKKVLGDLTKMPYVFDITSYRDVISRMTSGNETSYTKEVVEALENNKFKDEKYCESVLKLWNGTENNGRRVINDAHANTLFIIDHSKVSSTSKQGKNLTYTTVGKNKFGSIYIVDWGYVRSVYKFVQIFYNYLSENMDEYLAFRQEWVKTAYLGTRLTDKYNSIITDEGKLDPDALTLDILSNLQELVKTLYYRSSSFKQKEVRFNNRVDPWFMGYVEYVIETIYRDEINIKSMNDYEKEIEGLKAGAFTTKKTISERAQGLMDNTRLFELGLIDFVEVDDTTKTEDFEIFEKDYTIVNSILPNMYNIPALPQYTLRFRKLGNYKASGIYSPTLNCITLENSSSFLHEYGHFLDYNLYRAIESGNELQESFKMTLAFKDTNKLNAVNSEGQELVQFSIPNGKTITVSSNTLSLGYKFKDILRMYITNFNEILEKEGEWGMSRKHTNYYCVPTEVFARCFEVYYLRLGLESHLLGSISSESLDKFKTPPYSILLRDDNLWMMVETYFDNLFEAFITGDLNTLKQNIPYANAQIQEIGRMSTLEEDSTITDFEKDMYTIITGQENGYIKEHIPHKSTITRKSIIDLFYTYDEYYDANYNPVVGAYVTDDNKLHFYAATSKTDLDNTGVPYYRWLDELFKVLFDEAVAAQLDIEVVANRFIVEFNKRNHRYK